MKNQKVMTKEIMTDRQKKWAFLLTHDSLGGLELNILKYAKYLKSINVPVILILSYDSAPYKWAVKESLPFKTISKPRKYFSIIESYKLYSILKDENICEVLLSTSQDLDLYCWAFISPHNCSRPFLTYYQQMQIGVVKKNFYQKWRFSFIHHWISPLPFLKLEVLEKTTISNDIISVHPLSMDTDSFCKSLLKYNQIDLKKSFGLEDNTFVFGIIGRIDPGKGQLQVLNAFFNLLKSSSVDSKLHLFIVGSATLNDVNAQVYENKLLDFIKTNKLNECVTLIKHTPTPEMFYKLFDVLIVASIKETFGMVTVEGLLSNLTIIGASTGGTKEILENGKLGLLYDPISTDDLTEKMKAVAINNMTCKSQLNEENLKKFYSFEQLYLCQKNFKKN